MNIPLLAGSLLAIFGIFLLYRALSDYKKSVASLEWPGVEGRLTDLRLWGKRNIDGEMQDAEKLIVGYEYEFKGGQYKGSSATFYTLVYPETVKFARSHSANSDVVVYCNPKAPDESVLVPGPRKDKPYSDCILGGLGVAAGLVVAVLGYLGVIG
jgi:hypothetical protein